MTEPSTQKLSALLTFYQVSWNEMTWRRNAGYRTIIIGFGFFAALAVARSAVRTMPLATAVLIAVVLVVGTLFGAAYLASNYRKYMAAAAQTVKIEEYLGAYQPDFLGALGALMPAERRNRPSVPLTRDPVSLWSILAFAAGGILTALAVIMV